MKVHSEYHHKYFISNEFTTEWIKALIYDQLKNSKSTIESHNLHQLSGQCDEMLLKERIPTSNYDSIRNKNLILLVPIKSLLCRSHTSNIVCSVTNT